MAALTKSAAIDKAFALAKNEPSPVEQARLFFEIAENYRSLAKSPKVKEVYDLLKTLASANSTEPDVQYYETQVRQWVADIDFKAILVPGLAAAKKQEAIEKYLGYYSGSELADAYLRVVEQLPVS